MKKIISLSFALTAFLLGAESAPACQCVSGPTDTEEGFRQSVAAAFERAGAVFSSSPSDMTVGVRTLTIPRRDPVSAFTMGGSCAMMG